MQVANRRLWYNEIIVDGDATRASSPAFVDAFFFTDGNAVRTSAYGEYSDAIVAREQFGLFQHEFGHLSSAVLVELNTHDWRTPFRAAEID